MYKHYDLETIITRAEQGEAEFQYRLGRHHLARTKNYNEAEKWFNHNPFLLCLFADCRG